MTDDERICGLIYSAAAAAESTHDIKKWPDVLAYKYLLVNVKPLLNMMGVMDPDLRETVVAAARLTVTGKPDDVQALANVINAAIETQGRRLVG